MGVSEEGMVHFDVSTFIQHTVVPLCKYQMSVVVRVAEISRGSCFRLKHSWGPRLPRGGGSALFLEKTCKDYNLFISSNHQILT